jgi:hypothetical protein
MVLRTGNKPSRNHEREVDAAMDETTGAAVAEASAEAGAPAREDRMARWKARGSRQGGTQTGGGAVYGLGMIGAAAYFFGSAESGRDYALAVPKAVFWPALLVYRLLKYLAA